MSSPEARARQLAETQSGVITRQQAVSIGVSDHVISNRVSKGIWQRLESGTYLLFGTPTTRTIVAAAVASLPAVASHRTAAHLHGLRGGDSAAREVTVQHRFSNKHGLVAVHESTDLEPAHIVQVDGIRATSVCRTIFDNALRQTKAQLRSVVDDAIVKKLVTPPQLADLLLEIGRRGRPGTPEDAMAGGRLVHQIRGSGKRARAENAGTHS